jgi:sec-independent protein translocase protein TatA
MISPLLIGGLGTPEIVLIALVILLLFGATKLPELARGSGRALRIFKAETKGLTDSDDETTTVEEREIQARARAQADAEQIAREQGEKNL